MNISGCVIYMPNINNKYLFIYSIEYFMLIILVIDILISERFILLSELCKVILLVVFFHFIWI